jgi:hypothetical protein
MACDRKGYLGGLDNDQPWVLGASSVDDQPPTSLNNLLDGAIDTLRISDRRRDFSQ